MAALREAIRREAVEWWQTPVVPSLPTPDPGRRRRIALARLIGAGYEPTDTLLQEAMAGWDPYGSGVDWTAGEE